MVAKRLYPHFQPSHYELSLALERVERTFRGTTIIRGTRTDATAPLQLHAVDLTGESATINGTPCTITQGDGIWELSGCDAVGDITIELTYTGTITDGMHGLYPCYYKHDGSDKELLATQLESHHARELFPCIDEPEAKATFQLTLTTETGVTVLSNTPLTSQHEQEGYLVSRFEETPRMSTYLLAFVVGELHSLTATTKGGVTVSTWATVAQPKAAMQFSLDTAVRCIEFFDDYFGTPYPLAKCDHVALPDFTSLAMENWGLVTYRESHFMVDDTTGQSLKEMVAMVIAHETSHQWFGNLVTMQWWDDLWLNESFANMMEYVAVDALYPQWKIWMTFATQEVLSSLRRDSIAGVQPVRTGVKHPDEISTLFDPSIVYAKGGRLLQMLRMSIGETAFRDGLRDYFKTHAYGNTTGDDLWHSLSAHSSMDIKAFMTPWLTQPNFPLLTVEETGKTLSIRQAPFAGEPSGRLWPIPLFSEDPGVPERIDSPQLTCEATVAHPLLNRGATAHTVIDYPQPQYRQALTNRLASGDLAPIDRLSFIHESSLLSRRGNLAAAHLLPLVTASTSETEEPVWDMISMIISDLRRLTERDETANAQLQALVAASVLPAYRRLPVLSVGASTADPDGKLRATLAALLLYAEHQPLINELLAYDTAKIAEVPGDMRALVCSVIARHGDDNAFMQLVEAYRTNPAADIRDDIAIGIAATRQDDRIRHALTLLADPAIVRPQDTRGWVARLMRNPSSRSRTWQWLRDSWPVLTERFAGDKSYDSLVRYAAGAMSHPEELEEFTAFFSPQLAIVTLTRSIELGIEEIRERVTWRERDEADLFRALQEISGSQSVTS